MEDQDMSLALLNVYEVENEGVRKHLICFLDPVLAGARGIDSRCVIGEFTPGHDRVFDAATFTLNSAFVATLSAYMNDRSTRSSELTHAATQHAGGWLYIVDPRNSGEDDAQPPACDLLGCYAVDESGQIIPNSFQYNENHVFFEADRGTSGIFYDRHFYDWLHAEPISATE
jgi:hypothetical protein